MASQPQSASSNVNSPPLAMSDLTYPSSSFRSACKRNPSNKGKALLDAQSFHEGDSGDDIYDKEMEPGSANDYDDDDEEFIFVDDDDDDDIYDKDKFMSIDHEGIIEAEASLLKLLSPGLEESQEKCEGFGKFLDVNPRPPPGDLRYLINEEKASFVHHATYATSQEETQEDDRAVAARLLKNSDKLFEIAKAFEVDEPKYNGFGPPNILKGPDTLTEWGSGQFTALLKRGNFDPVEFMTDYAYIGHVATRTSCANTYVTLIIMALQSASETFAALSMADQHHMVMLAAKFLWFSRCPEMRNKGENWHSLRAFFNDDGTTFAEGLNDLYSFLNKFVTEVGEDTFKNTIEEGTHDESNDECFTKDQLGFLKKKLKDVEIEKEMFMEMFKYLLRNIPSMHLQAVHWLVYQNLRAPVAVYAIALIVTLSGTKYVPMKTILRLHLDKLFQQPSFSSQMGYLARCCELAGVRTFIELFAFLEKRGGKGGLVANFGGNIDVGDQVNAKSKSYIDAKVQTFTARGEKMESVQEGERQRKRKREEDEAKGVDGSENGVMVEDGNGVQHYLLVCQPCDENVEVVAQGKTNSRSKKRKRGMTMEYHNDDVDDNDENVDSWNGGGNGVTWHLCGDCDYKAKRKSNLKKHRASIHNENVVWQYCKDCDFKAKQKSSLNEHRAAIHNKNVTWHYCKEKDCDYKAKQKGSIKIHRALIHNENVTWHKCEDCDYKAKRKGNLKQHRARIHNENVIWHYCKDCDYKTKDKGNLKKHRANIHK